MKALFRLPTAAAVYDNPSAEELQQMTAKMPNARWTKFGNLNLETRVVSRSTASTFVISDEDDPGIPRTISSDDAAEWIDKQDAYIADREMIVIDGYLGAQPDLRTPVRLFMEAANANVAGMQQELLFPVEDPETLRAGARRHLHAEPRGAGHAGRPPDHRRPRAGRHPRLQLRLLR